MRPFAPNADQMRHVSSENTPHKMAIQSATALAATVTTAGEPSNPLKKY